MLHLSIVFQVNGVKIDNAEDLDVVMPMYKLLEYSENYKKQQEVTEINQVILFQLILNLLITRQVLQEKLIMLMKKLQMMMVMKLIILIMMPMKLVKIKLKLLFH